MNKIKLILLAATFGLAMTFTLSCSMLEDDKDESNPSSSSGGGSGMDFVDPRDQTTYKTVKIDDQTWMAENLKFNASGSKCYGQDGYVSFFDGVEYDYTTLTQAEITANCTKFGRLYDWATAMALTPDCNEESCDSEIDQKHQGICPEGWHIPSNADWDKLLIFAGKNGEGAPYYSYDAGKYLKASSGWSYLGEGDEYCYGMDEEGMVDDHYCEEDEDGWYWWRSETVTINGSGLDTHKFKAMPAGYGYDDYDGYYYGGSGSSGIWWSASNDDYYDSEAYTRVMSSYDDEVIPLDTSKDSFNSVRCLKD
jgi:uncharacterized protein (TIGR02145 family)